jgi:hypothetical protein
METIIIDGRRELKDLPELWYTDGTDEANEWGKAVVDGAWYKKSWKYVGTSNMGYVSLGSDTDVPYEKATYITPSEFLRLVYEPWKESKNVKLPSDYMGLRNEMIRKEMQVANTSCFPTHIDACIQLTNIMNFANNAFEGDGDNWEIDNSGHIDKCTFFRVQPILFTSKAAAEWAYKTFPEIFKAYWNV